ncbi:MAG: hypothetical protein ACRC6Z_01830, partial [Cetobacterium sp.]
MKVNINTNHIRIYKMLGYTSKKNVDFIAEFLKMDIQNVKLYIKQIYSFTHTKESKSNLHTMITNISKNTAILKVLKKHQSFSKENRIFYI